MLNKIKLKYLYLKTLLHQKLAQDGGYPFEYYSKLTEYVSKYQVRTALECGTAIGLGSFALALGNSEIKVITLEKHKSNMQKAMNNLNLFFPKLQNRIEFVNGKFFDVLEKEEYINQKYDLIFLDAYVSRLHDIRFLVKYLNVGGIFIVSNIRKEIPKSLDAYKLLHNKTDNFSVFTFNELKRGIRNRINSSTNKKYSMQQIDQVYGIQKEVDNIFNFKFEKLEEIEDTLFVRRIV